MHVSIKYTRTTVTIVQQTLHHSNIPKSLFNTDYHLERLFFEIVSNEIVSNEFLKIMQIFSNQFFEISNGLLCKTAYWP